jgi:hypothetical protein
MKSVKQTKLDTKSEIKLYILISILFTTIIILDYINFGSPCFITD